MKKHILKFSKTFVGTGHQLNDQGPSSIKNESMDKNLGNSATMSTNNVVDTGYSTFGVLFKCPELDQNAILTKKEWLQKALTISQSLKKRDPIQASVIELKFFNRPKKVEACIEVLIIYCQNILNFPEEEKYKSIKMSNKIFSEKVKSAEGGLNFLEAVGFEKRVVDGEEYLVYNGNIPTLSAAINALQQINGSGLELDRDRKISKLKKNSKTTWDVPDDFFELSAAEIALEQQERATKLEKERTLMTKAMREAEGKRRKALYTRIRIRFPNDTVMEGTFSVGERLGSVREFIEESFQVERDYKLMSPPSTHYDREAEQKTLEQLNLQPAVQLVLVTSGAVRQRSPRPRA